MSTYPECENHREILSEREDLAITEKGSIEDLPFLEEIIEERILEPSASLPRLPERVIVAPLEGISVIVEEIETAAGRYGPSEEIMDKKYRLQIDFSERAYKDLELLQEQLDANSKSEVIRNALGVLRWVVEEARKGHRILVEKPDGPREIIFHFIDQAVSSEKDANLG